MCFFPLLWYAPEMVISWCSVISFHLDRLSSSRISIRQSLLRSTEYRTPFPDEKAKRKKMMGSPIRSVSVGGRGDATLSQVVSHCPPLRRGSSTGDGKNSTPRDAYAHRDMSACTFEKELSKWLRRKGTENGAGHLGDFADEMYRLNCTRGPTLCLMQFRGKCTR